MRDTVGRGPPVEAKKTRIPVDTSDDSGYWYALVGFITATLASSVYISLRTQLEGTGFMHGPFILLWLFGLAILGIITYPAQLLDAAYLRDLQSIWQPKMWYWLVLGFGIPLGTFVISWIRLQNAAAWLLAIIVFIIMTNVMCARFLYLRHVYIGEP